MKLDTMMQELEALGKERTKKIYMSNGAKEPLFGVTTGSMKPYVKQIKINQEWLNSFMRQATMMQCILPGLLRIRKQ